MTSTAAQTARCRIPCDGCHNIIGIGNANFSTFHPTPTLQMRVVGLDVRGRPRAGHQQRAPRGLRAVPVLGAAGVSRRAVHLHQVVGHGVEHVPVHVQPGERAAREHPRDGARGRPGSAHQVHGARDQHGRLHARLLVRRARQPRHERCRVLANGGHRGPGSAKPHNVAGDTDVSWGDWYGGHELSHTFGRRAPGFCNGNSSDDDDFTNPNGQISDNLETYVGLDRGDPANGIPMTVISPFAFDIMTYCNQPQWYSAYNYEGVLHRFNAENGVAGNDFALTAARRPPTAPGGIERPSSDFVQHRRHREPHEAHGRHRAHRSRGPRRRAGSAAEPASPAGRFVDAAGKVLGTFPTWVRENSDADQSRRGSHGLVQIVVPSIAPRPRSSSCWRARS